MKLILKRRWMISFWRYFNIITYKTYANLKSENEKTYIGCLWWVVEPILNTVVFYLVFTQILKMREPNLTVFIYIGMVAYGYFSNALATGANAIVAHAGLMQQIYLPKIVFVIISVCNLTWKFLFSLLVLFPLLWFSKMPFSWAYLILPVLLLLQFWIILGMAMLLAAWIPYFQDGRTVLNTVLGFSMWFSGVLYGAEMVPQHLQGLFYWNPVAVLIEAYRAVLINGQWPNWPHFNKFFIVGIAFWVMGLYVLNRVDRRVTKINV